MYVSSWVLEIVAQTIASCWTVLLTGEADPAPGSNAEPSLKRRCKSTVHVPQTTASLLTTSKQTEKRHGVCKVRERRLHRR